MPDILPEGTYDLPKVGKVKKVYVFGGVMLLGVVAILWYRQHKAAQDAASSSGFTTDSAGNVGTIDPATGYVYGSPQDVQALEAMGQGGATGGGSGGGGGGDTVPTQVENGPPFSSNAAWSQYVTAYLTTTSGIDAGTVLNDLGKYLAGAPVTVAERDAVINPAVAVGGPPPVAGPDGFPPSINLIGSPTGGGPPGAPTLTLGAVTPTSGVVKWAPVSGASSYAWTVSGAGTTRSGTVTGHASVTIGGLTPSTAYEVTVHAVNSSGAGPDATITLKTRAGTAPPAGSYAQVEVVQYHEPNPPWNSTIAGIAAHYGHGSDWESTWNDPKNAGLRAKRGVPEHIQPHDIVFVLRK